MLAVDAGLPFDDLPGLFKGVYLLIDAVSLSVEQRQTLGLVSGSLPHQCGESLQFHHWHSGFAELGANLKPVDINLRIAAATARGALNRADE